MNRASALARLRALIALKGVFTPFQSSFNFHILNYQMIIYSCLELVWSSQEHTGS